MEEDMDPTTAAYSRAPAFIKVREVMTSPTHKHLRGRLLVQFVNILNSIREAKPASRAWWRTLERQFVFNVCTLRDPSITGSLLDLALMLVLKTHVVPSRVTEILGNAIISGYTAEEMAAGDSVTLCLGAKCVWPASASAPSLSLSPRDDITGAEAGAEAEPEPTAPTDAE